MTENNPDSSPAQDDSPASDRFDRRAVLTTAAAAGLGLPLAASARVAGADVDSIVDGLSLTEKIRLVHGHEGSWTGYIPGLEAHGVPDIAMLDGPVGVRTETGDPMTAFPASIAMAATFDPDLMYEQGRAMGRELKAADAHCLLGPALNIHRVPTCGRNFEYYSEDPHLTARMAAACCKGIQDEDVVATPKHYVANHQETERENVIANIDERALREIYLPGFKAAVQEGGAGSVMTAYNGVNGANCSENEFLLTDVLKDDWDFDGYVVSDWDAIQESVPAANAGLDLDMPGHIPQWGEDYFNAELEPAVRNGEVPESRIDEMVRRILRAYDETGHLDGDIGPGEANTDAHQELSREIAEQGAVLLKNEDEILPLEPAALDSIAVVGDTADEPIVGGGGAAEVEPPYAISAREGLETAVGDAVEILDEDDGSIEQIAADADVVLAFGHVDSSEFEDRDMHLDGRDDEKIQRAADANPDTVAVLRIPGPIEMPWLEDVAGVLSMWYPGMEDGTATANLLVGDATPSGKLPTTFGASADDYPATVVEEFYGDYEIEYDEGVFVGYRHFDEAGIEPLFPFGYGLSYTSFEYGALEAPASVDPDGTAEVSIDVTNTGDRAGAEIVQLYVEELDPALERPPRELAGFDKVWLEPGETGTATVELDREVFQYWHPGEEQWTVDEGSFEVHVGASSRDIRASTTLEVTTASDDVIDVDEYATRDTTGDGLHNDFDGDGETTHDDVTAFFEQLNHDAVRNNPDAFDFADNGEVGFSDVIELLRRA